jgi:hypothetical protein
MLCPGDDCILKRPGQIAEIVSIAGHTHDEVACATYVIQTTALGAGRRPAQALTSLRRKAAGLGSTFEAAWVTQG